MHTSIYRQADLSDVHLEVLPTIPAVEPEYQHIQLSDLEIISTLGIGGFGRVELVSTYSNY